MCMTCYAEAGAPCIVNEKTLAAAELVRQLYATEYGAVGGTMHVVTDDWNLEDDHVAFCVKESQNCGGPLEQKVAAAFAAMTEAERASTLALEEGWLYPDGTTAVQPLDPEEE